MSDAIDTSIEIVTPENIAFKHRVAGPFRRLPAYLVDIVIRMAVLMAIWFVAMLAFGAARMPGVGAGMGMMGFFLLDWFYGGLFETFFNGQTPGKRLMRIRVVSDEGQPINGFQAILRNVLRSVDSLPTLYLVPTYLLGFFTASMNNRFQRLGDLASGTMVVVEEPQRHYGVARVDEPEAVRLAAELPASFEVSRGLARALSSYVQRRQIFAWRRRAEIAMHVGEPLRIRFGLPPGTSHDLLLCALYHRTFIADRPEETAPRSPFRPAAPAAPPGGQAIRETAAR